MTLPFTRYSSVIGKTISLRKIDIKKDLDIFHEWHNQPRVFDLWELNKSKAELKDYVEKGLQDPHQIPLILEFDGEAAGYFEVYWAAQDRIAPYYDVKDFDRGFHFLIGNQKYLGRKNTVEALITVMLMIFEENEKTQRIVAEPRSNNKMVLKYASWAPGWRFIKEFDFPHKRAALLMAKRDDFFREKGLS